MKNKENEKASEIIKRVVRENKAGLSPEELKRHEDVMIKIFEKGMLPAEAMGFSQDFLEYVYTFAYTLFQQNKIEEASQLYRWLKKMVPLNQKYIIALAHCFIQQKNWIGAVENLMELAYMNLEDPYPFAKICDCLIESGDLAGALIAIDKAIIRAGDKQEYATEKERWSMSYEYLLSQLEIDPEIIEKVRAKREEKNLNSVERRK